MTFRLKNNSLASLGVLLLLLPSCSSRPEGVLDEDNMADLLADLYVGESYTVIEGSSEISASGLDSVRRVLRQSTLRNHGLTQADFDSTLSWYGHNLERYSEVCEKVIETLERREREAAAMGNDRQAAAGSSLWTGPVSRRLSESEAMTFELPGKSLKKGERLEWQFKTINQTGPVETFMAVRYADGTTGFQTRSLSSIGVQTVGLQTDTARTISSVYGYLRSRQAEPLLLDSILLTAQPYNATLYYEINTQRTFSP